MKAILDKRKKKKKKKKKKKGGARGPRVEHEESCEYANVQGVDAQA